MRVAAVLFLAFLCATAAAPAARAFWIWTPESGLWANPRYAVKPTPKEQLVHADLFFASRQYGEALREYRKLLKHYERSREAAQAQFQIGRVWEELKKYHTAVQEYQKVVDRYPFSDLGPKVVERQYLIADMFMKGWAKDSKFATSLLGTEYNVVEVFRKVIRNDPYGPYAPVSQYKIGMFYMERGEYQQARDEFEKTFNDYPSSKWAGAARYQIAQADAKRSVEAQYDQQATGVAVEGFKDFIRENPESELSEDARKEVARLRLKEAENAWVVAEFYLKSKQLNAAKIYFADIVAKYGDTPWGDKARVRINEIDTGKKTK